MTAASPGDPVTPRPTEEIRADVLAVREATSWAEKDDALLRLFADIEPLLAAVEAAQARAEEAEQLADFARLLGPASRVLDSAAEGVATHEECAAMAQRIVDLIGHSVTDEPPHALVERDEARARAEELQGWLDAARADVRERDAQITALRAGVAAVETQLAASEAFIDEVQRTFDGWLQLFNRPGEMRAASLIEDMDELFTRRRLLAAASPPTDVSTLHDPELSDEERAAFIAQLPGAPLTTEEDPE